MIMEIENKLKKMTKSEIFQICRKMKCQTGTKREMIRYIMIPLKNKKYKMENRCDECVICYDKKSEKPEKTICGHCFHPDCLKKWTQIKNTCPYCRKRNPTFPFKFNNKTLRKAVMEYAQNKENAIKKYGDISKWNVSNVRNMSFMFSIRYLNEDISKWDVSNVTNMSFMFYATYKFNGDLSEWNVSNVTNMEKMFEDAKSFNGDVSKWNVSNVKNMGNMFSYAKSFNGDLSAWNVSNVTDMTHMFRYSKFNGDISKWDVSNVKKMNGMFIKTDFNGDLSKWNVSNVTKMNSMFRNAKSFNGDLSKWNVSNVTNMREMFKNAKSFNGDLSEWDVSNMTNTRDMFINADSFNTDSFNTGVRDTSKVNPKTTEIQQKLQKMTKSEIEQICRKMKYPMGTKREMIRQLIRPLIRRVK
jgi:surface protein